MTIFSWLCVGHFVGDWLLQNEWMALGKKKGLVTWPGIAHFTIYTCSLAVALGLSGAVPNSYSFFICFVLIVFITHWLIDATHLVDWWVQVYRQSDGVMMRVMVDQIFHALVIVFLVLTIE